MCGWDFEHALKADQWFPEAMQLPKTVGRDLLTRKGSPEQTVDNGLEYEQDRNRGYFLLLTGPEAMKIWAYQGLHCYVDSLMKEKKKLGKVLNIEEVAIPAFSVFIGNGCVQHAGQ